MKSKKAVAKKAAPKKEIQKPTSKNAVAKPKKAAPQKNEYAGMTNEEKVADIVKNKVQV